WELKPGSYNLWKFEVLVEVMGFGFWGSQYQDTEVEVVVWSSGRGLVVDGLNVGLHKMMVVR
ncbi:hypothetical protein A2U01_0036542, partial [Trifolium medium]|nr:hypothetical protein [Trifolium medium]